MPTQVTLLWPRSLVCAFSTSLSPSYPVPPVVPVSTRWEVWQLAPAPGAKGYHPSWPQRHHIKHGDEVTLGPDTTAYSHMCPQPCGTHYVTLSNSNTWRLLFCFVLFEHNGHDQASPGTFLRLLHAALLLESLPKHQDIQS